MMLGAEEIFRTFKNTPKKKPKICQKPKLASQYLTINKASKKGNNPKIKLFLNSVSENENPFSKPKELKSEIKKKTRKNTIFARQKINIKKFKTKNDSFEDKDSYINNALLASESGPNIYENNINIERKKKKKDKRKKEINTFCKTFKNINQKYSINKDNQGNNNLNNKKKGIFANYSNFNKNKFITNYMVKTKINSIPIQKYKENKTLFTEKYPLIDNSRCKRNIYKYYNNLKNSKKNTKIKSITQKKILYTKEAMDKINLKSEFPSQTKNDNNNYNKMNNNSLFQNCTNESYDSSFLGSSLDDDFYHKITSQI